MARIFNEFASDIFDGRFRWLLAKTREENAYLAGSGTRRLEEKQLRELARQVVREWALVPELEALPSFGPEGPKPAQRRTKKGP
jgi:hypothetical protein